MQKCRHTDHYLQAAKTVTYLGRSGKLERVVSFSMVAVEDAMNLVSIVPITFACVAIWAAFGDPELSTCCYMEVKVSGHTETRCVGACTTGSCQGPTDWGTGAGHICFCTGVIPFGNPPGACNCPASYVVNADGEYIFACSLDSCISLQCDKYNSDGCGLDPTQGWVQVCCCVTKK
jgi:hypothetical protein